MRRILVVAIMALAVLLTGCGAHTPPALVGPTATAVPSDLPTVDPTSAHTCGLQTQKASAYVRVGDLVIGRAMLGALSYPSVMLPDGTAFKPIQVTTAVSNNVWSIGGPLASLPPANPALVGNGAGYEFTVCDASQSTPHTLQALSVRLLALTPYTGQMEAWKACDSAYSRQQPGGGGGCGGMGFYDETLKVSFPSGAGQGATATARQMSSGSADGGPSQVGPLPLALAPGQSVSFDVQMDPLSSAGTYTFAFGLTVDGGAPTYVPGLQAAIHAPVVHSFTGAACQQSSMASQIPPATTPPSYYICPEP